MAGPLGVGKMVGSAGLELAGGAAVDGGGWCGAKGLAGAGGGGRSGMAGGRSQSSSGVLGATGRRGPRHCSILR